MRCLCPETNPEMRLSRRAQGMLSLVRAKSLCVLRSISAPPHLGLTTWQQLGL